MIPKTIHYCWFGKGELTSLSKQCIASWEKTGYEIKRWDDTNIEFNSYLKFCYDRGKYANMSNYYRMIALNDYGGIYLDTDVEVVKSINGILDNEMFLGWEDHEYINNAVFGSVKGHWFMEKCIDEFNFDGNEAANISSPIFITKMISNAYGVKINGELQVFNDLTLYPKEYFYPYNWKEKFNINCIGENTIMVHRWEKKW